MSVQHGEKDNLLLTKGSSLTWSKKSKQRRNIKREGLFCCPGNCVDNASYMFIWPSYSFLISQYPPQKTYSKTLYLYRADLCIGWWGFGLFFHMYWTIEASFWLKLLRDKLLFVSLLYKVMGQHGAGHSVFFTTL